ncbi:Hypothetical protein R9X50_00712300 [Acrodontium crateriforme]|uniref:Uncharacterized protein n=1 Tax=Acrodontium crateriforme TaxID=150365 RepID=A0AAQ3M9N7_9PEZI|nr:Hypothetical protein R9X50_00712300 [Acrodontium crateriforme]
MRHRPLALLKILGSVPTAYAGREAGQPAKVDIHSLLEQPGSAPSPGNASTTSRGSNSSKSRDEGGISIQTSITTSAGTPTSIHAPPVQPYFQHQQQLQHQPPPPPQQYQQQPPQYQMMQSPHYPPPPPAYHQAQHYPPQMGYPMYGQLSDPRMQGPPIPVAHAVPPNNKRHAGPHLEASPAKKKQSKWTADEDASIIELRGNGMKWEDISKHLPGRSAISCRLRFQNYLERRSEWDEEKKNKLARLYERFKKDMWEKISKEMQLPWRAAEAMHWQIGEIEMAQRANVPVFHLAGQQGSITMQSGMPGDMRTSASTSPTSATDSHISSSMYSHHTHNHSLPQISQPFVPPLSPEQSRFRRNSIVHSAGTSPPISDHPSLRRRADSARSVPAPLSASSSSHNNILPPLGDLNVPQSQPRYNLPPVVTSTDAPRR